MLRSAHTLASAARTARCQPARSAHTLSAEAPIARPSALRGLRPTSTALKVAGGVVGALGLGLYIRAAPPSSLPFSLWARQISAAEVQAHAAPDSCWVIIDGSVYDVTSWRAHHPVGAEAILAHAGQDISSVFEHIHRPGVRAIVQLTGKLKPIGVADPVGQRVAGH